MNGGRESSAGGSEGIEVDILKWMEIEGLRDGSNEGITRGTTISKFME